MNEEIKKEAMDMELSLDNLEQVLGGTKVPSGGTVLHFPDNCPQCGAKLIKIRSAKKLICNECGAEIAGTP